MKQNDHKETEHYYWTSTPIYKTYETIEVDDYCDSCGNVEGSHTIKRGVGEPIKIEWKRHKKDSWWYMSKTMERMLLPSLLENIMKSSVVIKNIK